MSMPMPSPTPEYAETFYDRLRSQIQDAEQALASDETLYLLYYAQGGNRFIIKDIGYHNPFLIMLYGYDGNGNHATIYMHVYSVQLVQQIVKIQPTEEKRHIGFIGSAKDGSE